MSTSEIHATVTQACRELQSREINGIGNLAALFGIGPGAISHDLLATLTTNQMVRLIAIARRNWTDMPHTLGLWEAALAERYRLERQAQSTNTGAAA